MCKWLAVNYPLNGIKYALPYFKIIVNYATFRLKHLRLKSVLHGKSDVTAAKMNRYRSRFYLLGFYFYLYSGLLKRKLYNFRCQQYF